MKQTGICILKCNDNHKHGIVTLTEQTNGNIKIKVYIEGISPGLHGFHVHRSGNIKCGATSLCDHYNPTFQVHGDLNSPRSHAGDLGNIKANKNGIVDTEIISKRMHLNDIFGRSLVVHEDPDDLGLGKYKDSLTTGHSGKRILWGIIARDEKC